MNIPSEGEVHIQSDVQVYKQAVNEIHSLISQAMESQSDKVNIPGGRGGKRYACFSGDRRGQAEKVHQPLSKNGIFFILPKIFV